MDEVAVADVELPGGVGFPLRVEIAHGAIVPQRIAVWERFSPTASQFWSKLSEHFGHERRSVWTKESFQNAAEPLLQVWDSARTAAGSHTSSG
ncbi:hypothetical protein GCM10027597_28360 [Saccharopolyspora tripterygii]